MKKRNSNTVQVHIANGDVSSSEDPRYVKRVGKVEFVTDMRIYKIVVTDSLGKKDAELFVGPLIKGPWRAHGNEEDDFYYTIETLFPQKPRRKKIRKTHTIIIQSGTDSGKRHRKPPRKKAARRAHTIIIHS